MIDILPPLGKYKYDTWRIIPMKCYIDNFMHLRSWQYGRSWNKSLPYAKLSYNNSYQESLKMTPFEMLYGHTCRTPLFWNETRELKFLDPTYHKMSWDRFLWWERTCGLRSHDRRVTMIIGEENWTLKLEITCTWGVTYERFTTFQGMRQTRTSVH
jgi:hypothetical protein